MMWDEFWISEASKKKIITWGVRQGNAEDVLGNREICVSIYSEYFIDESGIVMYNDGRSGLSQPVYE